ncbi:MAG TPA: HAMP domain-containing sensor histidine kinase [Verrucomicrobiae bacterium]|nr:HAMP domain-containing sensor histidine kinase [Verrucomicrobiae bacterium]
MPGVVKQSRPSFFWQGVLIIAPVAVLASVAIISLIQDRRELDGEAFQIAEQIAERLHRELRNVILPPVHAARSAGFNCSTWFHPSVFSNSGTNAARLMSDLPHEDPVFRNATQEIPLQTALFNSDGELLFPPPISETPTDEVLQQRAGSAESRAWAEAIVSEFVERDLERAASQYGHLAESGDQLVASKARFTLGLVQLKRGLTNAARETFHSASGSEAGLPIIPNPWRALSRFHLASLATNEAAVRTQMTLMSADAIHCPTLLTPLLLEKAVALEQERAGASQWKEVWETHERSRALVAAHGLGTSGWLLEDGGAWLCAVITCEGQSLFVAQEHGAIASAVGKAFQNANVPGFLGARVEIAGHTLYLAASSLESLRTLASTETDFEPRLAVAVLLRDPAAFYARQRQRQVVYGSLIGITAMVAFQGFRLALRSFRAEQALNEQKSNFVSSVSHELRAPIASVRLMAESLERGAVSHPGKQQEYFRFIVQECRRLSSLIENVLDFSRIEQGRKLYDFEPTDLRALTSETVKVLQPYADERGVTLRVEVPSAESGTLDFELMADGRAIQQALINLIDNAVKHSPRGECVIVKLTRPEETRSPSPALHISVSDHGRGIPATEHARIFERFYRLGSELRRETQGVGIGLSIVKHIVNAHGGCIHVESRPGKGSRFTIELPIHSRPMNPCPAS